MFHVKHEFFKKILRSVSCETILAKKWPKTGQKRLKMG